MENIQDTHIKSLQIAIHEELKKTKIDDKAVAKLVAEIKMAKRLKK